MNWPLIAQWLIGLAVVGGWFAIVMSILTHDAAALAERQRLRRMRFHENQRLAARAEN